MKSQKNEISKKKKKKNENKKKKKKKNENKKFSKLKNIRTESTSVSDHVSLRQSQDHVNVRIR